LAGTAKSGDTPNKIPAHNEIKFLFIDNHVYKSE
jgi:hypothetical protein